MAPSEVDTAKVPGPHGPQLQLRACLARSCLQITRERTRECVKKKKKKNSVARWQAKTLIWICWLLANKSSVNTYFLSFFPIDLVACSGYILKWHIKKIQLIRLLERKILRQQQYKMQHRPPPPPPRNERAWCHQGKGSRGTRLVFLMSPKTSNGADNQSYHIATAVAQPWDLGICLSGTTNPSWFKWCFYLKI